MAISAHYAIVEYNRSGTLRDGETRDVTIWSFIDKKKGTLEPHITYALQCRSTQRMF